MKKGNIDNYQLAKGNIDNYQLAKGAKFDDYNFKNQCD